MKYLIIAAVLGVTVIVAFLVMGAQSRNGASPGTVNGKLMPCSSAPNCVSSSAEQKSQYVAPYTFADADAVWNRLTDVIIAEGGTIVDNAPPYLAATFQSAIFGFVDDFELVIDNQSREIQVRAGARVGYSDMNVNRQRVERIRAGLKTP